MSENGIFKDVVRTAVGALRGAAVWYFLGLLISSWTLGIILALWSLLIGPLFLPFFFYIFWRVLRTPRSGGLVGQPWDKNSAITQEYFKGILEQKGLRLRLWVFPAKDVCSFWFESFSLSQFSRQELVVSSGWMALPDAEKRELFGQVWNEMAGMSRAKRQLRTAQIALWMACLFPLEILLMAMRFVFESLFPAMPSPAFWLQGLCGQIQEKWFGRPAWLADVGTLDISEYTPQKKWLIPQPINSLVWGVWFSYPENSMHPLWKVLMRRNIKL